MNPETASSVIESTPRASVGWLETVYVDPDHRGASDFALEASPEMMALPGCALGLTLTGDRPVVAHATDVSVKFVMAALVPHRAGIRPEEAFDDRFTDDPLVALRDALRTAKFSRRLIETPVVQPRSAASADH